MKFILVIFPFIISFFTLTAIAADYSVGPAKEIKKLSQVVNQLQPGDRVLIEPGEYREVMKITARGTEEEPIVIKGVRKTRPVFNAEGLHVSGRGSIPRAIFQIEGSHIIIENIEFKNARNGNNGAGIRLNESTSVTIRDCFIHHCDMGIQGGDTETVLIENCDIGFNSTEKHNGFSHNLYMLGNRVVMRNCYVHDALYGQNFKSRAHYNELWYNWIVDSNEGEVGPVDGRGQTEKPHSNVVMVGNVIVSKPDRTGNNAKYVLVGSELGGSHNGTLYMFYNVLIAGSPKVKFIQLDDPQTDAVVKYNLFHGSNQIVQKRYPQSQVQGQYNWLPNPANTPNEFEDSLFGNDPGFLDRTNRDFRLMSDSPFWQYRNETVTYIDGEGEEHTLEIDLEEMQDHWRSHEGEMQSAVLEKH